LVPCWSLHVQIYDLFRRKLANALAANELQVKAALSHQHDAPAADTDPQLLNRREGESIP